MSKITTELGIVGVSQDGDDLVIDLYGGPSNACGVVRFQFSDHKLLETRKDLVQRWCSDSVMVDLIEDGETVTLVRHDQ